MRLNITFLIGNGFDLNVGLKTTFSAFLKEYKVESEKDSDLIKYFKNTVLQDTEMWSNAELAFGMATKQFKDAGYTAEDYCICHEDFCVKLAKFLEKEEQRLNYTALDDVLSKGLVSGIRAYKNGFRTAEREIIEEDEMSFNGGFVFNFLTYNYTAVLDLCVAAARRKNGILGLRAKNKVGNEFGKVLHVHGTIVRDMVLGVNDISQIADETLFDGCDEECLDEIIKMNTNIMNEENTDEKAHDLLMNSDLIYIYGMAIGKTDELWWNRICALLAQKKQLHLIIHQHNAPEDGLIRRSFKVFVKGVKRRFTAYSALNEDKKREIEERIHVDATNIFAGLNNLVEHTANIAKNGDDSKTA